MQIHLRHNAEGVSMHRSQRLRVLPLFISISLMVTGWAATPDATRDGTSGPLGSPTVRDGIGSFYGKEHHGKKTANGEIFDMNKLTAAHRSLPFGSIVKVTNLS